MANVSKLLYSTVDPESLLSNLHADDTRLREGRVKIRAHLRSEFERAGKQAFGQSVRPRFFTQGSHAYRTLNDRAWTPPQQKDLDDGCYLPLSFVKGARPSVAASLFFDFVDTALLALAKREGWTHVPKPTCVRVILCDDAHVDVPLYAIPDAEFRQLQDRAANRALVTKAKLTPDDWDALPSDSVLLAHRDHDWMESDPRKIHAWFLEAVALYGERLRRTCRYLKAWRDHHGADIDCVTSIFLMASAWRVFEDIRRPFLPDREDELLLRVAERLPTILDNPLLNPTSKEEDFNRLTADERRRAIRKAEALRDGLRETINSCSEPARAIELLTAVLGSRVPNRPDLVSISVPAPAAVLSYPRKEVPAPVVGRSKSG
jgi:hypothetical protein